MAQGKAEIERKEYDAALQTLGRGLAAQPEDSDLLFQRGLAHLRKGDYDLAAED